MFYDPQTLKNGAISWKVTCLPAAFQCVFWLGLELGLNLGLDLGLNLGLRLGLDLGLRLGLRKLLRLLSGTNETILDVLW